MPRSVLAPCPPEEMRRFLDSFIYVPEAFFVTEVTLLDAEAKRVEARLDTTQPLPLTAMQRVDERHPAHVSAPEMIQTTGNMGCLHAWFFYGVRWDEGWVGFGNRIHRADFKTLAHVGPPLRLESIETRARHSPDRLTVRYEFRFHQEDRLVYFGDQTATFLRDRSLAPEQG